MAWVRIDDAFPGHPKVASICVAKRPFAVQLHINALCWSNAYLTDGRIPIEQVHVLGADIPIASPTTAPLEIAEVLVAAGMWERDGNSFRIHDFHDFQPSRRQVEARRKDISDKRKQAGSKGGSKAASKRAANVQQMAKQTAKQTGSPVPDPLEEVKITSSPPTPTPSGEDFWEAWRAIAEAHGVEIRIGMSTPEFDHLDSLMAAYTLDEFRAAAEVYWQAKGSHSLAIFRSRIADDLAKSNEAQREAVAILERPTTWTCKHCGRIHETPRRDYLAQKCPAQEVA